MKDSDAGDIRVACVCAAQLAVRLAANGPHATHPTTHTRTLSRPAQQQKRNSRISDRHHFTRSLAHPLAPHPTRRVHGKPPAALTRCHCSRPPLPAHVRGVPPWVAQPTCDVCSWFSPERPSKTMNHTSNFNRISKTSTSPSPILDHTFCHTSSSVFGVFGLARGLAAASTTTRIMRGPPLGRRASISALVGILLIGTDSSTGHRLICQCAYTGTQQQTHRSV